MSEAPRRGILAGGNFIVDTVKIIDHWPEQDTLSTILERCSSNGGGPYNVLKNLARLDTSLPREACGLIGDDPDGQWLLGDCAAAGIDTTQLRVREGASTSVTDAMTVAGTGRRTFFHAHGANALLDVEDFDFGATRAKIFLLGYLMLLQRLDRLREDGGTGAAEVLRRAREAGLIAAIDCVSFPSPVFREVALPSLREADLFFANEIEAGWILGKSVTLENAAEAVRELAGLGRADVVLHLPEAAFACAAGTADVVRQASVAVSAEAIVGATGAGDAFATGYLHGLHAGAGAAECLERGVCVAAMSLTASTPSDGVGTLEECLGFGRRYGYRRDV